MDISNCFVSVPYFCSTVYLKQISNCVIFIGPVQSSVLIHSLVNCVICVFSRQLRIHECNNCHFYYYTSTDPIIEGCSNLRFGKLQVSDPKFQKEIQVCGIQSKTSSIHVNDFDHLILNVPSPHWTPIDSLSLELDYDTRQIHPFPELPETILMSKGRVLVPFNIGIS